MQQYLVIFTNYAIQRVWAVSYGQAVLMAQANQIIKGESHNVDFVKDDSNRVVYSGR